MKTLLITFSILMMTVACSKEDPQATFQQEKEEAIDYVDESESVDLNKNEQRIKVNEKTEK